MKATDLVECGSSTDTIDVPLVGGQSASRQRSGNIHTGSILVPVVDAKQRPLMPCKASKVRRLVKVHKATPFFKKGIFAIRLNKIVKDPTLSKIVVAIDPGSKRTGITVATEKGIVLNVQCDAPEWVEKHVNKRKVFRRSRRQRKTPSRKCKYNRTIGSVPPSTKSRWQAHLRIVNILKKIVPVSDVVIEDIKASTKKACRSWNKSFSPLEVGKKWFEAEIIKTGTGLHKFSGMDTYQHRNKRNFVKAARKLSEHWETHCVDSHCLAELELGKNIEPVKQMLILGFIQFHRRELHRGVGKNKENYGSTRSMGFCRGTVVKHKKHGLVYLGGTSKNRISLHSMENGKRVSQSAKIKDLKILTRIAWTTRWSGFTPNSSND